MPETRKESRRPHRSATLGWWVMMYGTLFMVAVRSAAAEAVPAGATMALLRADWPAVLATLEKSDVKAPDGAWRMVAAHAWLAENRNNQALILFLTAERADAEAWKAWTETLSKANPDNAVALYLHGDALARVGDPKGAEVCFTEAVNRDPKLGLAWVARGVVRVLSNRSDEGYMDFMRAIQAQPTLADAHASLGALEVMFQNAEGALERFNEALRLDPRFALAYNGRGCARYGLGQPDEAALDFEMAGALCPPFVVCDVNHGFVLAMVAQMIDRKAGPSEKPGTTLTTSTELSFKPGSTEDDIRNAISRYGLPAVLREISRRKQGLASEAWDLNQQSQRHLGTFNFANNVAYGTEWAKQGWKAVGGVKSLGKDVVAGELNNFLRWSAFDLAKGLINRSLERTASPEAGAALRTFIAGAKYDRIDLDPVGVVLQGVQELAKAGRDRELRWMGDINQSAVMRAAEVRWLSEFEKRVSALGIADNLKSGATGGLSGKGVRDLDLNPVSFSSSQPWSQMPRLVEDIAGKATRGPVAIVAQDPVKSFAFQRMLDNKGIPSVVVPPTDKQQFDLLRTLSPRAVVGFRQDMDAPIYRKPLPSFPPDKGGGAGGIGSSIPVIRERDTFSFPGTGGTTAPLPLPSRFEIPKETWNSFKPWTPPPSFNGPGGVDTKQLEWVFVDKGHWPVMTIFTLLYEPLKAGR